MEGGKDARQIVISRAQWTARTAGCVFAMLVAVAS